MQARKRIAVIGAGISGMAAAYRLAPDHDVTLYESEGRIGGHARTRTAGPRGDQTVDTGFIVFNYATYPHLTALFAELDVPVTPSTMSWGASFRGGALEYGLADLDTIFAQRRNIANPRFLRMIRDILRFNAQALEASSDPDLTIGGLIAKLGLSDGFRDHYLLPFSGAIWSTPTERILDFPAAAMVRFFRNHGLLHHAGQHQWWTVQGGSVAYVSRLEQAMRRAGVTIRLNAPIAGVRRTPLGAEVRAHGADWDRHDEVVFATHSDDTLAMLADATPDERRLLGAIGYQPNRIVLHSDPAIMPQRRKVWSSWTYTEGTQKSTDCIDLSYWMNSLQPWLTDLDIFITLNATRPIRQELIWDEVTMRHPVFDLAALAAQEEITLINGENGTWFCGAWMRNGFHEDGIASAMNVVDAIRTRVTLKVAAE
jgi:predicted NAD/FAD-binding protein